MLEVPSILILLPDLAAKVVVWAAAGNATVASSKSATVRAIIVRLFIFVLLV
jgi:hypothetical protein